MGIDYQANVNIIKAVNGISDPSRIYIGQKILLPTEIQSSEE
jgi:LysM repeat protein